MIGYFLVAAWCLFSTGLCSTKCYYGKHGSVAAASCQDVIQVQPECHGESGFYWLGSDSGGLEYVYCDMEHRGGGWRRVMYYHSGLNTTCPLGLIAETFFSGSHTYCKKFGGINFSVFSWNNLNSAVFSEVRGYVSLRVKAGYLPDAFSDVPNVVVEYGYIDGFEMFTGPYPSGPFRMIFSYVVGASTGDKCPSNGGMEEILGQKGYRDSTYSCDEVDTSSSTDSEGFYTQSLFDGSGCVQCPPAAPWFERTFPGKQPLSELHGRIVNSDVDDETIYITALEVYVR